MRMKKRSLWAVMGLALLSAAAVAQETGPVDPARQPERAQERGKDAAGAAQAGEPEQGICGKRYGMGYESRRREAAVGATPEPEGRNGGR